MPNNKMYNSKYVLVGLAIFLVAITIPIWYNHGKSAPQPELKLTEKAKAAKMCVAPRDYMRAEHMQLLDEWRDTVVREAERDYVSTNGQTYEMSLSNTCLDCHSNKAEFCDQCHNYASVDPFCWDCHIDNPKEN